MDFEHSLAYLPRIIEAIGALQVHKNIFKSVKALQNK